MLTILIDKLLKTQVVECAAVANWIFSGEMAHDFTRLISMLYTYIFGVFSVQGTVDLWSYIMPIDRYSHTL